MTTLLSISATPNAPVACDMTAAEDSLAERLAEYRRLFDQALLARESDETSTTFRFADRTDVRAWVLDLVRREAACCPFLSYEVDAEGEQIEWRTAGIGATDIAILDELLTIGPSR
ncbi:hypothetical protein ACIA03_16605 [Nocardioides sp. NPDC051685]|uniref:hypothetical protein n=1 Tax=Nocardioides sp. NPDC051685 TaxID=3364334 RepID=UPI0037BD3EB2